MGKMLLGEFSVSQDPPLKNRDKLPIPQISEGWRSELWQLFVRERAVVAALPWDHLTKHRMWMLVLAVHFWDLSALFGKRGQWPLIESASRIKCHIPEAWEQLREYSFPLLLWEKSSFKFKAPSQFLFPDVLPGRPWRLAHRGSGLPGLGGQMRFTLYSLQAPSHLCWQKHLNLLFPSEVHVL